MKMVSTLRFLLGSVKARAGTRRRPAWRPDHKVRLRLESLESRMVTTILFMPHFGSESVFGCPDGMQHPAVNLVFSGDYWSSTQGATDVSALVSATKTLLSGPYLSGLTQYGSDGTATPGSVWTDAATVPSNPSGDKLQSFLQSSITFHGVAPGANDWQHAPIYVVISDPSSALNDIGGWNAAGTYLDCSRPENMHMIWVGTSTDKSAGVSSDTQIWLDGFTSTLSHELAETISDPDASGIQVSTPAALPASLVNGNQIGDNEPELPGGPRYGYRLNGNWVQPYWSALDNAFIVPDGTSQKFNLYPIWSGSTFTGRYQLDINGDQYGTGYNDRITITQTDIDDPSGSPLGSVRVTLNGETATFDRGGSGLGSKSAISSIYVDTGQGRNSVNVAGLPYDVVLNIKGGLNSNDTVTVGSTGSLFGIAGTVNVSNDSGRTSLVIDDSNDSFTQNFRMTSSGVTEETTTGLAAGPTVNYQPGSLSGGSLDGVTALTIRGSRKGNSFWVDSVAALTTTTLIGTPWDMVAGPAAGSVRFFLDGSFYYVPTGPIRTLS